MYYSVIFFTIIIFVIILHITPMIFIDVVLQCSWFRDGFSTRNIYESDIAYLLMACSERFSTWNTFVIKFLPWIVSWICLFRDILHIKRLISFVTTTVWFLLGFCWHTWSIRCYFLYGSRSGSSSNNFMIRQDYYPLTRLKVIFQCHLFPIFLT